MGVITNVLSLCVVLIAILVGILNSNIPAVNEFIVNRAFSNFQDGLFCLELPNGQVLKYGDMKMSGGKCDNTMIIHNKDEAYIGIVQGAVGIGRTYFEGHWDCKGDLGDFFTHLLWNVKTTSGPMANYIRYFRWYDWNVYFDRMGVTKDPETDMIDVRHAYFNSKFFEYMLDGSMTYTCGLWNETTKNLYEAQVNKVNVLLHKLRFPPAKKLSSKVVKAKSKSKAKSAKNTNTFNVLDVGCGWGFLASYIHNQSSANVINNNVVVGDTSAKTFNVTGITLSDEQFNYAMKTFGNKKNEHSPYFYIMDFRDLVDVYGESFFDGIVSVGVISHIHIKRLDEWFDKLYRVLKPGGYFIMQGIVGTQAHNIPGIDDHFVKKKDACTDNTVPGKYIFPGGCILLADWIQESANRAGFINMHREYIGQHYTRTLYEWRMNLERYKKEIMKDDILAGNEQFYRMYEIYLANCEAAFRAGSVEKGQFVFFKPANLKKGQIVHTQKFEKYMNHIHIPVLNNFDHDFQY